MESVCGSVKEEACSDSEGSSACWSIKDEVVWSPGRVQKRVSVDVKTEPISLESFAAVKEMFRPPEQGDEAALLDGQAKHELAIGSERERHSEGDGEAVLERHAMVRPKQTTFTADRDAGIAENELTLGSERPRHACEGNREAVLEPHAMELLLRPKKIASTADRDAGLACEIDAFTVQRLPDEVNDINPATATLTAHFKLKTCCVRLERIDAGRPRVLGIYGAPSLGPTSFKTAFICDSCGKTFKRKYLLIRHINLRNHRHIQAPLQSSAKGKIKNETKDGAVKHLCETCGKQFSQKSHLNRHNRSHTGEKLYACDICNGKFTRLETLKSHKWVHTGEKLHFCEICNKQFTRKRNLKLHKVIHDGEKPYTCEICKRQFTGPNNFDRHKRTHTGEVLYTCEICDKDFTRLSNLKEHEWIHTGQKPYRCEICKRQFTRLRTLKIHEKKFHEIEY